jgi:hypothetical protein
VLNLQQGEKELGSFRSEVGCRRAPVVYVYEQEEKRLDPSWSQWCGHPCRSSALLFVERNLLRCPLACAVDTWPVNVNLVVHHPSCSLGRKKDWQKHHQVGIGKYSTADLLMVAVSEGCT